MNESPGEPRDESVQSNFTALQNGIAFSDHGHVAFVEISKRFDTVLTGDLATDQFTDVAALLHRNLGNAG